MSELIWIGNALFPRWFIFFILLALFLTAVGLLLWMALRFKP